MAIRAELKLPDITRPRPDSWYIKMMINRLKWSKCEDRDQVIAIFRLRWPDSRISNRAEEFYDRALQIMEANK